MSDEIKECRICFEGEKEDDLFISPCRCSGTSKYVHYSCLNQWREFNTDKPPYYKCMECNEKYLLVFTHPREPTKLFWLSDKIYNFYLIKYTGGIPISFVVGIFSMFNNHSLILEGLNGGHDNLIIYDEFRKDLFLETSFYYMYSVILVNFFILMVYLMVTCDKIKNKKEYFSKTKYYFISDFIYNCFFYIFYVIFVWNDEVMMFLNIALFLVLSEPFLCYKLFKKHKQVIHDINSNSEDKILPYGFLNPLYNLDIELGESDIELDENRIIARENLNNLSRSSSENSDTLNPILDIL